MTGRLRLTACALAVAIAACAHSGQRLLPSSSSAYDRAMARRADSLIQRLAAMPGEYLSGGVVYSLHGADYVLLEDLGALSMRAVPALIECVGDTHPSNVTYVDYSTGERHRVPVGFLCHGVLQDGPLSAISDEKQEYDVVYVPFSADAEALRRAKRVWQGYLAVARGSDRKPIPSAAGCYEVGLHRTTRDIPIDTSRRWRIALDTMPFPGTVHPDGLELAPGVTLNGRARWRPYYQGKGALVYWQSRDSASFLSFGFGADDPRMSGFYLKLRGRTPEETFGGVSVKRTSCD